MNASLEYTDFVQPVAMADFGSLYEGSTCAEVGWSTLGRHKTLQWTSEVKMLSDQYCRDNPGTTGPMGYGAMCGGEPGSGTAVMCPGYTGSPLLCSDPGTGDIVLAGVPRLMTTSTTTTSCWWLETGTWPLTMARSRSDTWTPSTPILTSVTSTRGQILLS